MSRNSEQILAIGIFTFCVFTYFILIPTIPLGIDTDAELGFFSPRVFPKVITALIAILSVFLGINAFKSKMNKTETESESRENVSAYSGAGIVLAVGFIYTYMLDWIGYTLSTPIVLAFYLKFFGAKNWIKIALISILTTVLLYFFFGKILKVMLPTGSLF